MQASHRLGLLLRLHVGQKLIHAKLPGNGFGRRAVVPRDHDNPQFVKDRVAHSEGADDPDPDLARLLRQVNEWLSKLGVET